MNWRVFLPSGNLRIGDGRLFGSFLFVSIFCLTITLIEAFFWAIMPEDDYIRTQEKSFWKPHPITGYQLNDDGVYPLTYSFHNGAPPLRVQATLAEGRRYTPMSEEDRNKFAVFFGDSFTFGTGVNDNETLPFYFGQVSPEYRPYNYGFPGGSVQNMYCKLLTRELQREIKEPGGFAFYWFFGFHTIRVVGGMPAFNKWTDVTACFEVRNDHLTYMGNFREVHPYRSLLYDLVYMSNTCRYANFFLPLWYSQKDFEVTARMLLESARLFKEQFPASEFIILFWDDRTPYTPVKDRVETKGIRTLSVKEFLGGVDNPLELKEILPDGHLTGEGYKRIAEELSNRLR